MPTLSSSYRDGTSESAKRHARGAAAHLAWLEERKQPARRVFVIPVNDVIVFDFPGVEPAGFDAFRTGRLGLVPVGSAVPAIDWLAEHGVEAEMSSETRRMLGL